VGEVIVETKGCLSTEFKLRLDTEWTLPGDSGGSTLLKAHVVRVSAVSDWRERERSRRNL
jgi:hypothetical protein